MLIITGVFIKNCASKNMIPSFAHSFPMIAIKKSFKSFICMLYDVAVIGAGPAGSTAALKLGEKGWDVALFERDEFAGKNNVCAGGLDIPTLENLGLGDSVIEKKLKGTVFRNAKGLLSKAEWGCLTVKRSVFDRAIAEKASKQCSYFPSTAIISVEKQAEHFRLSSSDKKFHAKIVVFADGPYSKIRSHLQVGFVPSNHNCYAAIINEFYAKTSNDYLEMVFDNKVSPAGYGWMFPKSDHVNIGLGYLLSQKCDLKKSLGYLIKNYYPEFSNEKPFLGNAALIPARIADKISDSSGIVCVGDAGGFVEPFTGGGINYGVMSSLIAAETIHNALEKNDKTLVLNFKSELMKTGWFNAFKLQHYILAILAKNSSLYSSFFSNIYATGLYGKILLNASKLNSLFRRTGNGTAHGI